MNSLHCNKAVFGNRVFHQAGVYQRSSSWAFGLPGIPGRLPTSPSPHPLGPAFSLLLAISSAAGTTPTFFSQNSNSFVVTIFVIFCHHFDQTPSGVKPKNISESFSLTKKADNLRHGDGTSKEWFRLCDLLLCHWLWPIWLIGGSFRGEATLKTDTSRGYDPPTEVRAH